MSGAKLTVGQAIDQIAAALTPFDDSDKTTILSTVCAVLKLAPPSVLTGAIGGPKLPPLGKPEEPQSKSAAAGHGVEPGIDIKTLKNQKKPASAREMACVVGYYLADLAPEAERKKAITAADIEKYFKQAGYKLPEAMEQVLPDAKKGGYFDSEARGEYKLNRVGYNAVVHSMPKPEKG